MNIGAIGRRTGAAAARWAPAAGRRWAENGSEPAGCADAPYGVRGITNDRTVQIPCPDETTAKTIQQVLWVDRELRPHDVIKTAKVQSTGALEVYVVQG